MITLHLDVYKYGNLNDSMVLEFESDQEIKDYIKDLQDYTLEVERGSKEYGENLKKFTACFIYFGTNYNLCLDL